MDFNSRNKVKRVNTDIEIKVYTKINITLPYRSIGKQKHDEGLLSSLTKADLA